MQSTAGRSVIRIALSLGSSALFACLCAAQPTFTNPVLNAGQDPRPIQVNGTYYYIEAYCTENPDICIQSASSLTGPAGLLAAAPQIVWPNSACAPNANGPNANDIWAPELKFLNGQWFIYYAADDGNNRHHRVFVLSSNDANGQWCPAATGDPNGNGQLIGINQWAIDPDVFTATDGSLYIVFSCEDPITAHQSICIQQMSDPLHTVGPAVEISMPTQPWEERKLPIEEGPSGYTRNGVNYILFSASASFAYDGYAEGLLSNSLPPQPNGEGNPLLNPGSWIKQGPIFDGHHDSFGTGSTRFIPSPDGTETWMVYQGVDCYGCEDDPAWNARSIRMQKMYWSEDGFPVLGYPADVIDTGGSGDTGSQVSLPVPSGDYGYVGTGSNLPVWGAAYGDAAEGNTDAIADGPFCGDGLVCGSWSAINASTVLNTSLDPKTFDQIFSGGNPNWQNYVVMADIRLVQTGAGDPYPKYGIYGAYVDHNNYYMAMIDVTACKSPGCLTTFAKVGGESQGWKNCPLPARFNARAAHQLAIEATNGTFGVLLNGKLIAGACQDRTFTSLNASYAPSSQPPNGQASGNGSNGQTGVVVENTLAAYTNFNVSPGAPQDGQTYIFLNQASQLRLDNDCDGCNGATPASGIQVIQYPGTAQCPLGKDCPVTAFETQQWILHAQGNGYFTIVSAQSGMCLGDPWGNGTPSRSTPREHGDSTMLRQIPCNGEASQNWKFVPRGNSLFVIENQAATQNSGEPGTPLVIDVYSGKKTQGLRMWLDYANGRSPQNWQLIQQ